jgi:hypothetical protein
MASARAIRCSIQKPMGTPQTQIRVIDPARKHCDWVPVPSAFCAERVGDRYAFVSSRINKETLP